VKDFFDANIRSLELRKRPGCRKGEFSEKRVSERFFFEGGKPLFLKEKRRDLLV
jgi:hypothetical protein